MEMRYKEIFDKFFEEEMDEYGYETNHEFMEDVYRALEAMSYWAQHYADEAYETESKYLLMHIQEYIEERLDNTMYAPAIRLLRLYEMESLDDMQLLFLLLAGRLGEKKSEYGATEGILLERAFALWSVFYGKTQDILPGIMQELQPILKYLVKEKNTSVFTMHLSMKPSVRSYLWGYDLLSENAKKWITFWDWKNEIEPFIGFSEEYNRALMVGETEEPPNLLLCGGNGSGKRFLVKHIAAKRKKSVLFVDSNQMRNHEDINASIEDLCMYAKLLQADICLFHYVPQLSGRQEEQEGNRRQQVIDSYLIREVVAKGIYVYLLSEIQAGKPSEEIPWMKIVLPDPDIRTKIQLWQHFLKTYETEDVNSEILANRYLLRAGEMKEILKQAAYIAFSYQRHRIETKDIVAAVKQRNDSALGNYADLLETNIYWDDLVVKDEVRTQLEYIADRLRYRNTVEAEWGFEQKVSYGKGICALFYGPPGTGKTMAVKALANEFGLELYRIDISRMVSKYIGETQKHISELFEHAKHLNALLFFDEADAFFSKRTNVNDSHDRNANSEVAHLLQKLEEYDGISILATNLKDNIDDAFKRRIKYMVHFSLPDVETRKQLWRKILPAKAPVADNLDLDYFAEHFEMSGSEIKDALIQAAFMAAREGKKITNRHIAESIRLSFQKYGKILQEEDFGYLL